MRYKSKTHEYRIVEVIYNNGSKKYEYQYRKLGLFRIFKIWDKCCEPVESKSHIEWSMERAISRDNDSYFKKINKRVEI